MSPFSASPFFASGVGSGLGLGAPPAAATIETVERDLGWELTHVYGLTETAPLITVCEILSEHQDLSVGELAQIKSRQGVELVSSGELRVVDEDGNEVIKNNLIKNYNVMISN